MKNLNSRWQKKAFKCKIAWICSCSGCSYPPIERHTNRGIEAVENQFLTSPSFRPLWSSSHTTREILFPFHFTRRDERRERESTRAYGSYDLVSTWSCLEEKDWVGGGPYLVETNHFRMGYDISLFPLVLYTPNNDLSWLNKQMALFIYIKCTIFYITCLKRHFAHAVRKMWICKGCDESGNLYSGRRRK